MTLAVFQQLDVCEQITVALLRGTYLARRVGPTGPLALYYVPDGGRGFFIEIGHDRGWQRATVQHSFCAYEPLTCYADVLHLGLYRDTY